MASRLALVLGDLFIPDRAIFKALLTPGKISSILFLGNLTSPTIIPYLHSIAPELHLVRGDFDITDPTLHTQGSPNLSALPIQKVIASGNLKIGFIHGHTIIPNGDSDSLLIKAREMDVDVLLWGGTHRFEAYEMEGKFFVNPGSATGAMYTGWVAEEDPTPSFCLMDVQGDVLVLYVYRLERKPDDPASDTVKVEKVSFKKGGNPA